MWLSFGVFCLSLHVRMGFFVRIIMVLVPMLFPLGAMAQSFFVTQNIAYSDKGDKRTSYSAKVEFPVEGSGKALESVREWICDMLGVDKPKHLDVSRFRDLLRDCCGAYLMEAEGMARKIVVERSFEDENCVTFEATITDEDHEKWTCQDCATFSKRDGHRLSVDEIFNCGEEKVKELMWAYRGDLPMEVESAEELVVGNAGYIDGWIIVIGPAFHYTGAAYKIRYEEVEEYLNKGISGGYH